MDLPVERDIVAKPVAGERSHESQVDARQLIGIGRPGLRRAEADRDHGHVVPNCRRAAGSGERPAGQGKAFAAPAADANQPARPVGVEVAADVVQIEVLQLDAVVGSLLPVLDGTVLDENTAAAEQPFDRGRRAPLLGSRPGIGETDRLLEVDIEPAGLQQLRIADDVDRILEMGLAAVEDHALLPVDLHIARLAQGPVLQVAIEELLHPPGTFHSEQVGAAIDLDVRPGEAHAAAFHVGRFAFDRDLRPWSVGLRGVQPLAGDQQRQLAGQGRLGLLQFHVVDDRDLGQFSMLLVPLLTGLGSRYRIAGDLGRFSRLLVPQEHAGLQQRPLISCACRPAADAGSCPPSGGYRGTPGRGRRRGRRRRRGGRGGHSPSPGVRAGPASVEGTYGAGSPFAATPVALAAARRAAAS